MDVVDGRLDEAAAVPAPRWDETPLWQALAAMRIEPPGAALSFIERLRFENGWGRRFAESVYAEYLRFLYLSAGSDRPLTPPDAVDQAWHLHLTYSRHYWETLCGEVLKRTFHHGPTSGGSGEAERYLGQYENTLALYRKTFGSPPPEAIWPVAERLFSRRHVRVDRGSVWVLPKARVRAVAASVGAAVLTAACQAVVSPRALEIFFVFLLVSVIVLVFVGLLLNRRRRRDAGGCGGCGSGSSDGDDGGSGGGGCGGGCGGD